MEYRRALNDLGGVWSNSSGCKTLKFISPVHSVMLAVLGRDASRKISSRFAPVGRASDYSTTIGLDQALQGHKPQPRTAGLAGKNYSPLTSMQFSADVGTQNDLVRSVIESRCAGNARKDQLCEAIGELHDNIVSHSYGIGFSALQVINGKICFAIADGGRGFQRAIQDTAGRKSAEDAIEWCFVTGNTSAGPGQEQEFDPMSAVDFERYRERNGNHHAGLGLGKLLKLVDESEGKLWVASGNGARVRSNRTWEACKSEAPTFDWQGVVMEVELPLTPVAPRAPSKFAPHNDFDDLF